ncbi:MAG: hypothetical protein ACYCZA_14215 [Thiobacillus sp.]
MSKPNELDSNTAAESGRADARLGAQRAVDHSSGNVDRKGTPPCNTVPCNYNPETFKVLRYGVDSLYVSYPGVLSEEWDHKLSGLKELAQSENEFEQASAQVVIGDHLFEVLDKGRGRFAYVLVDNCYHLQASNKRSKVLPLAYVQISSEYLSSVGVEQAELSLRYIVNTLGLINEPANISRVDLFVDFVAELRMDTFDPLLDWVTRTQSVDLHYRHNQFSGWSFGMGGSIGARLYNKRLEVEKKSHKFYLYELWQAAGWDTSQQVWRMEFEAKRDALKSLGIYKLANLLDLQTALWIYLTQDWLRLAVPMPSDTNQTRWPTHPLWDQITRVFDQDGEQPKLKRFTPMRLPADERLFVHGMGGLTSFMAARGIEDMGEGIGEYFHQATEFHNSRSGLKKMGLELYLDRKVKVKSRRYNTKNNRLNLVDDKKEAAEKADAYQQARDGE